MATNRIYEPPNPRRHMTPVEYELAEGFRPSTAQFGRATWLDDEEIQDAPRRPIGPERVTFRRTVLVLGTLWLMGACTLVGAFSLLRGALRLIGVI
jgi:hypothetical protein